MVRKLIKYDFIPLLRLLLPAYLVLFGVALINRVIQLFESIAAPTESFSVIYQMLFSSSIVLYCIGISVCTVMTLIVCAIRFYQALYSNEGYLNNTLPVTPSQHIFAKLLSSLIFCAFSVVTIFLSFIVLTFGELNVEIFKAIGYLLNKALVADAANTFMFTIEIIIAIVFGYISMLLLLFMCVSIGQLANKRKILLSVGVFFGIYTIGQFGATALSIGFALSGSVVHKWIEENPAQFFQGVLVILFAAEIVVSFTGYFLSRYLLTKKLNLA